MIRKMTTRVLTGALGVAVASAMMFSAAQAAPQTFTLETPHTQILFSVNHLGFSNSYGKFTGYSGTIVFDPDAPETSSVEVSIDAKSVELNDAKWNDHVRNADFLDTEKFPSITFKSTKIDVTGEKTANITGDLTIRGVTKPVVLATVFNKLDKHPMSGEVVAGFSATTKFKRSDFGVSYGVPNVGDDMNIIIEVETSPAAKGDSAPAVKGDSAPATKAE